MKLIFSRKGFDSGSGGGASAILPDGRLVSFPIPDYRGSTRYAHIQGDVDVWKLVADLSGNRYMGQHKAHLDPDLNADHLPRAEGWRGAFGQTSAAARHLLNQGVGVEALFLFFGWFRDVELKDGRWRYLPKGRNIHALFGWLQVETVLSLASGRSEDWQSDYPWLRAHPHTQRGADPLNHIFIGGPKLVGLDGLENIPGYGTFPVLTDQLQLTNPLRERRSIWALPSWFRDEGVSLSYHGDDNRWRETDKGFDLDVVGRGQEFVLSGGDPDKQNLYLHSVFADPSTSSKLPGRT
jgi:hypothetical protein